MHVVVAVSVVESVIVVGLNTVVVHVSVIVDPGYHVVDMIISLLHVFSSPFPLLLPFLPPYDSSYVGVGVLAEVGSDCVG